VAANAGGAFSPFGDITTLMIWQAGRVPFADFFGLVLPSLVNWLVPVVILSFAIRGHPVPSDAQEPDLIAVLGLFLSSIVLTVVLHTFLALPPGIGMMAGLGLSKGCSQLFNYRHPQSVVNELDDVFAEPQLESEGDVPGEEPVSTGTRVTAPPVIALAPEGAAAGVAIQRPTARPLDIFAPLEKFEWDTLLFFYGVLLGVVGLEARPTRGC
jgi:Na+/H+ antiporter NhaD/arsenite permease-like protein